MGNADDLVGRSRRKPQREGGSAPDPAPHRDRAAMLGADVLDDRQSEPGPAGRARTGRVDAVEPFEDAVLILWRDAAALIGHRDLEVALGTPRAHNDPRVLVAVGDRVADEVAYGGHEQVPVAQCEACL